MRIVFSIVFIFIGLSALAQEPEEARPQTAAPAGEIQSARQPKFRSALVSSFMSLRGTRDADNNAYAYGDIRVYSQTLGLEYVAAPNTSVIARAQYLNLESQLERGGRTYGEHTHGMGDTLVGTTHILFAEPAFKIMGEAGVYLPTGATNAVNPHSAVPGTHYSYRLQLGSGTVDPALALATVYKQPAYSVGAKASAIIRTGENAEGYRLGNIYRGDVWADMPWRFGLTPRLTGFYRHKEQISGQDHTLAFARNGLEIYYHDQIDWNASAALKFDRLLWNAVLATAEAGIPFYQGMRNNDHVVASTNYYGSLGLIGQF